MKEYNYCTFSVLDGAMTVLEKDQFECRGDNVIAMMKKLIQIAPEKFEGKTGYVSFWDNPPTGRSIGEFDLMFATTTKLNEPNGFLPFPCPYSHSWPQVGIPDGRGLLRDMLDFKTNWTSNRAFWIGADTHSTRRKLIQVSADNPESIEASMMEWKRDKQTSQQESKGRYVSMWDHRHYKYLIDCPGTGYSARLRWLIASGRPVFIVERPVGERWHLDLKPWVHFIPVRSDLSDLMLAYKRLEADADLYDLISSNARAFAKARFILDPELAQIAKLLPGSSAPISPQI